MEFIKILTLSLIFSLAISQQNVPDTIKKAVNILKANIPNLKNEINSGIHSASLQNLLRIGYTKLSETGTVVSYNGVQSQSLDLFSNYLINTFKITNEVIQDFKETIKDIEYMDFKAAIAEKFFFTEKAGGAARYLWVLGERIEETSATNWLIVNFQASFTLAPNVYYVSESHCSWWGLSCNTSTKRIEVPANLTTEEIYLLGKFYEISTLELLS
jgi:hypothetical protein